MSKFEGEDRRKSCALRRSDSPWHQDKKFALSLIVALLFNSCTLAWYASQFNSRLFTVEANIKITQEWREKAEEQRMQLEVGLGQVAQQLSDNSKILDRIEMMLDKQPRDRNYDSRR